MMATDVNTVEPTVATAEERTILRDIDALLNVDSEDRAMLLSPAGEAVVLPDTAYQLLRQVVQHLANDEAVSVIPVSRELTTQQAADLLNVSRPYLIQLLDRDDIPYHRTGTHRRIRLDDLLTYKRRRDAERREGLRQLTRKSQRLGLYGRPKST
jgi:excisionase family DNA binding protein